MSKCSKSVQNHVHIKKVSVFPHDFSPDRLVQTLPRVYTEVMGPLDDIIERSRKQLSRWTTPPLRCTQVKKPKVNGGRIGRTLI